MKKFKISIIEEPERISNEELADIIGGKDITDGCFCMINTYGNMRNDNEKLKFKLYKRKKDKGFCIAYIGCTEND
jgi:hypothetical protein